MAQPLGEQAGDIRESGTPIPQAADPGRAALDEPVPAARAERETENSLGLAGFGVPWNITQQRKCTRGELRGDGTMNSY